MKINFGLKNIVLLRVYILLAFVVLMSFKGYSQAVVKVPFKPRTSQKVPDQFYEKETYHLQGDFTMIGNANASLDPYDDNGNNRFNMKFNKLTIDAGDATIKNSSSSDFQLPSGIKPSCTKIIYAGLYWTGRGDDDSGDVLSKPGNLGDGMNKKKIKFKVPGANYVDITSEQIVYDSPLETSGMYTGYFDITDLVRAAGTGTYSVANIATFEGSDANSGTGYYGGWGMVVIYENATMKWRDINVFDGFAKIKAITVGVDGFGELAISGFHAAQKGNINVKMGMMAGEGDRNISGDYFSIKNQSTGLWQPLSHSGNQTSNFFNSSINTGGNLREPSQLNNFGVDVCMFDLPNTSNSIITNNQTSTAFRFGTLQDTYSIFNITFAVDAFVPDVEALNTTVDTNLPNNSSVVPGQEVEFKLDLYNKGTEAIQNGKIEIQLPSNAHYVSSELTLGTLIWSHPFATDPAITPGGTITWNIGDIPMLADINQIITTLKYKIKVTTDCTLLTTSNADCGLAVTLNGKVSGTGVNSGNPLDADFITGYQQGDCNGSPIRDPFLLNINSENSFLTSCPEKNPNGARLFKAFCSIANNLIPRNDVTSGYPAGTKFYKAIPGTPNYLSSLVTGDFPVNPNGTGTKYYAIPQNSRPGCYLILETLLEKVTTSPVVGDIEFCEGSPVDLGVKLSSYGTANALQLYYFNDNTSTTPLTNAPAPTQTGTYNYFVSEGKTSSNGTVCMGPKVPFKVTINAMPTFTKNLSDFYVCVESSKQIGIEASGATVTWEFYDVASTSWKNLTASSFNNQLVPSGSSLNITNASLAINGLKIRSKLVNGSGCNAYSNEAIIEVRVCKLPANPMIRTKFKKN